MKLLAALLLLALGTQARADGLDAAVIAAAVADLGTTEWALRRAGAYEANAVMREPAMRVALKAAAAGAVVWSRARLRRSGRRRAARVVGIVAVSLWAGAAGVNAWTAMRG